MNGAVSTVQRPGEARERVAVMHDGIWWADTSSRVAFIRARSIDDRRHARKWGAFALTTRPASSCTTATPWPGSNTAVT
jgi:hypothetical protein